MSKFLRPYCFLPFKLIQYDILFDKQQIGKDLASNVGTDFFEENHSFFPPMLKIICSNNFASAKNDVRGCG